MTENIDPRAHYREFKARTTRVCAEHSKRDERYLNQVEVQLRHQVLQTKTASLINQAIENAAAGRKIANNGGHQDDGENMRFRLGQAVVCYFRWAFGENLIDRNIYPKNPYRRPSAKLPNYLDTPKLIAVREKVKTLSIFDRVIVHVLMDTGMRVSELARLRFVDINFQALEIRIHMTKVERDKNPVITEETAALLKAWHGYCFRRPGEFVCQGYEGRPMSPAPIRRRMAQIGKDLGFRTNPHSFRHALGAVWMKNGAAEREVLEQLGHRDRKMADVYIHLAGEELRKRQFKVYASLQKGS